MVATVPLPSGGLNPSRFVSSRFVLSLEASPPPSRFIPSIALCISIIPILLLSYVVGVLLSRHGLCICIRQKLLCCPRCTQRHLSSTSPLHRVCSSSIGTGSPTPRPPTLFVFPPPSPPYPPLISNISLAVSRNRYVHLTYPPGPLEKSLPPSRGCPQSAACPTTRTATPYSSSLDELDR